VGIPFSIAHTANVNSKIEEDINKKYFNSGEIKPREFRQGFIWFKLSDDAISEPKEKNKLTLRLVFKKDNKLVDYNLALPSPKKTE
jgi:hypothetical protein